MTTQIQVTYKPANQNEPQETELFRFQSRKSAEIFFATIVKNPDVQSAKIL